MAIFDVLAILFLIIFIGIDFDIKSTFKINLISNNLLLQDLYLNSLKEIIII